MTWRRAFVYWSCFAVLWTTNHFVATRRAATQVFSEGTRFVDLEPENVQAVTVARRGTRVRAERRDERWRITTAAATVPSDLVAAVVASLTDLPDIEVVAEAPGQLNEFSLDPPELELTLEQSGAAPLRIRLGARNPSGTAVYAQRDGDGRVFLIGLNVRYYMELLIDAAQGR